MPQLTIGDKSVTVGDEFLQLSPADQNAAVQHIAEQIGAGGGASAESAAPAAPAIGENRASMLAALRGVPIAGAFADKAAAALNAAAQPLVETGLSAAPTFSERMAADEQQLKAGTDAYEQSHPIGTTAGKIALGTAAMAPFMAAAPTAFGLTGATLAARAGAGAASGGLIGGVDAAARGDSPTSGLALGALLGAGGPVAGQIVGKVANSIRGAGSVPVEAIPSGAAIKDAAKEGYDAVRASGVTVKPESVQNLASEIQNEFVGDGFRSYLAPKTFSALDELKNGDAFTTAANRGMGEDHAATVEQIRAKYGEPAANAYDAQMLAKATPAEIPSPAAAAAAPEQSPLSLLQFIASKGGIAPDAELEAIGLARGHREQIPGRNGFFGVVHKDGADLDRMREAAQEAGYLRGSAYETSTPRDLLDAIDTELRGQKRYPEGQEGYQTKRQTAAMSEREQAQFDAHIRGFENDLAGAGHGELGPVVKQRAVKLMADEGMDADTAVEHALHQLEQEDSAAHAAHAAGFPGDNQPAAAPMRAAAAPQAAPRVVSFSDLHGLRRVLGKAAQSADGVERAAASSAMMRLDRYLENIPSADVIGGDANKAASMLKEANANYTVSKIAERLQGKVDAAELQAASANSGANLENALRQRLKDILKSERLRRGFTQRELIEIQKIVRGTAPANVIRALGNMLGGGGGLGTIISGGAGALAGGPLGAVVAPAAGFAFKKLGGKMTEAQIARLDEMIRARAPLSAQAKTVSAALDEVRRARLAKWQTAGAITSRGVVPIANGALDDQRQRRR